MASLSPTADPPARRRASLLPARSVLLPALLFTLVLTAAWTARDLSALAAGRLPDNDDMMRLAQVRDWLQGQAFDDLVQHRLGPAGGASMHWSRLGDAGPALLLLLLTPVAGGEAATLAMLVLYPALLLFLSLLVLGRIARRLAGEPAAGVAVILGALAFPTVSLFVPGRIDHHGLQILLMLLLLDAVVAPPSVRAGLAAGIAAALSLATGLETAPEIVAAMAALFVLWAVRGGEEDARAGGLAIGLGAVTGALLLFARPQVWPADWCDGFTPASSSATLIAAGCWAALALAGRALPDARARLAAGAVVGGLGLAVLVRTSSVCFTGPYGALDPLLTRLWMDKVGEADSLLEQENAGTAIAYGGLCLAGVAAGLYRLAIAGERSPRWIAFMLVLLIGVAAAVLQIRVAYVMAAVATLPLAALIAEKRARGAATAGLLALWLAGCGFTYNLLGNAVDRLSAPPAGDLRARTAACLDGNGLARLAGLEPGTVMAPLDSGAAVIGTTPHRAVAAPYHRNNAGNLAMYRFFLSPPEEARAIARAWSVDYVALCPSSFGEIALGREGPGGLAATLRAGRTPDWLEPVAGGEGPLRVWRATP